MGSFYQPKSYLKGGSSFYQSKSYFKGGMNALKIDTFRNNSKHKKRLTNSKKRVTKRVTKGGFYPTVMANLLKSGSILMPLAMRAGYSLFSKTRKNRKVNT